MLSRSGRGTAGLIASHLFQTYRYPAYGGRHFSADLWTAELQDHAIGILQLNASSPSRNGAASSDRAVSAFNRSRPFQIEGPSDQLSCRGSDREADAHARYGEWIVLASQGQHALAAADPDNKPAFREYDGDLTGIGPRWLAETSHAYEQGNRGDIYAKLFHDFFPLKRRDATPTYWARSMDEYPSRVSRMPDTLRVGRMVGLLAAAVKTIARSAILKVLGVPVTPSLAPGGTGAFE
jgi:hypothetical protein